MNKAWKYGIALLLLMVFSMKTAIPVFAGYRFLAKTETAQQQEKDADEKEIEKEALKKGEYEFTHSLPVPYVASVIIVPETIFRSLPQVFLPVCYFSVPTPPPWCKS